MYSTRPATSQDYTFLFELKKAAEYEQIHHVFGWDDAVQKQIHKKEWNEAKPTIIEVDNKAIGSFLLRPLEDTGEPLYFSRFFLLPEFHGSGIGSAILKQCLDLADEQEKRVTLCYLQGSRVGRLYKDFGFVITHQDVEFVYMQRIPNSQLRRES
ncbi:GNAT family N-acetyltransferase [Marinomonas transparens]|uniref:GNAT family N-acetyltransferase n=1 Tax=Marinomonas transparens TaxID=2795388 RepID=A0A934MYB9_9GAMM|nr:GNAT family N-acetyltransferase [Marinomonas transparens]MBJ7536290.1 GNAT family N-acetyltransferase [Marinomonas transparens]